MNLPDYTNCTLCPRMCHVNRSVTTGYCGCSSHISAARAALHKWEEPVLSGPEEEPGGSGAVFFSGCTLRCCFCQNSLLSKDHFGKKLTVNELGDAFLRLQDKGAYNINLVTPTQFFPDIIKGLCFYRPDDPPDRRTRIYAPSFLCPRQTGFSLNDERRHYPPHGPSRT